MAIFSNFLNTSNLQKPKSSGSFLNFFDSPLSPKLPVQQSTAQQTPPLIPKPASAPTIRRPDNPAGKVPIDLSSTYGMNNGTIYRKSDNTAFSRPEQFFGDSGQKSFDNLKFDTTYQPLANLSSQSTGNPADQFAHLRDTTTPEQLMQSAANTTSPYQEQQTNLKGLFDSYMNSVRKQGEVSPEEAKAREELTNFRGNAELGINALGGQGRGIPLGLIRGQQSKLGEQAAIKEKTLSQRLMDITQQNQARRDADTKSMELQYGFAKDQINANKPTEAGGNLIKLNPVTGQYETVFSSTPKSDIREVNGELVSVGANGKVTSLYGQPKQDYGTGSVGEYNFYAQQEKAAGKQPVSFNEYQNMDANRKMRIARAGTSGSGGSPGGLTNQQFSRLNTIADNARQDPNIKTFPEIRAAFETAQQASNNNTGAGDIVLMRALAKITDPTTGVKEEEFKTFQSAQGKLATLGISLAGLTSGKRLTASGRQALLQQAQQIYQQREGAYSNSTNFFTQQANRVGGTVNDIMPVYTATQNQPSSSGSSWLKYIGK
jgi:hypothetical protein